MSVPEIKRAPILRLTGDFENLKWAADMASMQLDVLTEIYNRLREKQGSDVVFVKIKNLPTG